MACEKVFQLKELREAILSYVIRKPDGSDLCKASVKSCRLVQKSWLHTTFKCIRDSKKAFYHFIVPKPPVSAENADVEPPKKEKTIVEYIRDFTEASSITKEIPPFSITASEKFFLEQNYPFLLNCLTTNGASLLNLNLTFPANGGTMPFIFPNLHLKMLHGIFLEFSSQNLQPATPPGVNFDVVNLIQAILNGTTELKKFVVKCDIVIPPSFKHLILPQTLTILNLSCVLEGPDWQVLTKCFLPVLKYLTLIIPGQPLEDGLLFKILQNVRATLKSLHFFGFTHLGELDPPTLYNFPYMEHLETVHIFSTHCELERDAPHLQENLPALSSLILAEQTVDNWRKWAEKRKFAGVTILAVSLVDKNFSEKDPNYWVNMDVEMMQLVPLAFQNLKFLEVTVAGAQLDGLRYLFAELRELRRLRIVANRTGEIVNSDLWDSLFIGVPVEIGTALQTTAEYWEEFEFKNNKIPSIKLLTELRELELETDNKKVEEVKPIPLISDAAFYFAFAKMEALKKLKFKGRFVVSQDMAKKWKDMGREIDVDDA